MGVSTDGQLSFGIPFEEGYEFPWDSEKYEGDCEEWWLYEVCNYKNEVEIYDESGEYLNGVKPSEKDIDDFYKKKHSFKEANPVPVTIVTHCSDGCQMVIVAVKDKSYSNARGYPQEIKTEYLIVTDIEKQSLIFYWLLWFFSSS